MGIYKVTERFDDKFGHGGVYEVGDLYTHADRIEALSTENNKSKRPFIKELTVKELKDKLGGLEVEIDSKAKKQELEELLLNELAK